MALDNTKDGGEGVREALEEAIDKTIPDAEVETSQEPVTEIAPPETWEEKDKELFTKIADPDVRKWLVDRDTNFGTKIKDYETRYSGFDDIFAPYKDRLTETGQQPVQVIDNLLKAQMVLESNPEEGFLWLAQRYGVDLKKLAGITAAHELTGEDGEDPLADLDPKLRDYIKGLEKKVGEFDTRFQTVDQQQANEVKQGLVNAAKEFRETTNDKGEPLYPFMSEKAVVDEMSLLIKTGVVKVEGGDVKSAYKKAYDRAIYSIPEVREKITKAATSGDTSVTKDRLLKARRAGSSLRGVGASEAQQPAKGTVREQLAGAFKEQGLL